VTPGIVALVAQNVVQRWSTLARAASVDRWILAIAVILVLPCVGVGFSADDAMLRVRAGVDLGYPGMPPTRWDLFVFVRDDGAQRDALQGTGFLSWWMAPGYRLGFLRPISSATHAIDFALWPSAAWAMYLHSIAWFVAMLAAARAVYRRMLPGVAAATALALYAFDDARGPVVGYISNRNALMMATFGFVAIASFDRWRRDGWRGGAIAAPGCYAIGLLAGEGTVAVVGYLFAYALLVDRAGPRSRILSLVPFAVITIAWALAYRLLGYGSSGSGIYIDPGGETLAYLAVAPGRILALLGAQWLGPWSDFWLAYPPAVAIAVGVGYAVAIATVLWLVRRVLPGNREALALALGAALACVPLASTFPADRLLGFVGLGGAGVIGMLVARWCEDRASGRAWQGFAALAIGVLVVVHAILGPLLLPVRVRSMVTVREALATLDAAVPRDASIAERELVVAFAPNDGFSSYLTVTRWAERVPGPRSARTLATSTGPVVFSRTDDHTLRVTAKDGLLTTPVERMVRAPHRVFAVGDRARLGDATAEIEAITPDGRPAQVRFTFPRPLEDPRYVWRAWQRSAFVEWTPPAIGEHVELAGFDMGHEIAVALGADP
jgi:hypothetical protein